MSKPKPTKSLALSKGVQKVSVTKSAKTPSKSTGKIKLVVESTTIGSARRSSDNGMNIDQLSDASGSDHNDTTKSVIQIVTVPCSHCSSVEEEYTVMTTSQLKMCGPAPTWKAPAVVNKEIKEVKLEDYKDKYLVFFFYPLDFTFVCPTEIIAFSDRVEEFRQIKCEVVACSCDSEFSHLAWINTPRKQGGLGDMNIPLVADKTGAIARAYGVMKEDEGIPFRGLFIIDKKQNLRQITINDLPVGRSVDEVLRLVQAFQFTDVHGEVCPAGWKPGKKTMKPETKASKEYFEGQN